MTELKAEVSKTTPLYVSCKNCGSAIFPTCFQKPNITIEFESEENCKFIISCKHCGFKGEYHPSDFKEDR